jgi:dolichyl-phosphate beta-glucosyltransferase
MQKPYLSVVIPSFNEQQNIRRGVLEEVAAYLSKQSFSSEIVLTDDGSSDGTLDELYLFAKKHSNVRVFANNHRGKGPTVYTGMTEALGEVRLFTDFDQATPIEEIEKLFPFVHKGYDVVIGSREVEGSRRDKEPFHRHLMGKAFNLFVNLFTVQGIHDTQCGFKLFTAKAVKDLFPLLWVYRPDKSRKDAFTGAFDVELLYIARKKGLHIAEVPVFWKYAKTNRVSALKDSARMFFDLLRIRASDLMGKYKK